MNNPETYQDNGPFVLADYAVKARDVDRPKPPRPSDDYFPIDLINRVPSTRPKLTTTSKNNSYLRQHDILRMTPSWPHPPKPRPSDSSSSLDVLPIMREIRRPRSKKTLQNNFASSFMLIESLEYKKVA